MSGMKIIVCVKVVLDPEAPASLFRVDMEAQKVIPPKGTPPVLNPFDENALEAALKIKDGSGASITIVSLGKNIPRPVIRKSLATGADSLVLLEDDSFEELDSYSTAAVLVNAIRKIGDYDLIFCGREASVTVRPGATALTLMLKDPSPLAKARVMETTPPLEVV